MRKSKTNELPFFPTLDAWLAFMQESFPPNEAPNTTYRDKIKELRQLTSVQRYEPRFYEHLLHINDVSNAEAMDKFIDRLKKELCTLSRRDWPKTLEKGCIFAYTFDATLMRDSTTFCLNHGLPTHQARNQRQPTLEDLFNVSTLLWNPVLTKGAVLVSAS